MNRPTQTAVGKGVIDFDSHEEFQFKHKERTILLRVGQNGRVIYRTISHVLPTESRMAQRLCWMVYGGIATMIVCTVIDKLGLI
ncbi:hypothetical protein D9M68_835810 [compost metagenome]